MVFCLSDLNNPEYRLLKVVKRRRPADDSNETVFLKDFIMKVVIDPRYSITDIARICYNLYYQELFFDPLEIINNSTISNERKDSIIKCYNHYTEDLHSLDQNIYSYSSELSDEALKLIHAKFSEEERLSYQMSLNTIENLLNNDEAIMSKKNDGINACHFISGKAGTGKTFIINSIIKWCIANNKTFISTASTGIAASIINGTTFHSAFQIFEEGNNIYSSLRASSQRGQALLICNDLIK